MRKTCIREMLFLSAALLVLCGWSMAGAEDKNISLSLTTGLPTDKPYRPVLVIVSNAPDARRSINFNDADVVYESIITGPNATRYSAIYNDIHPKSVGSVRSARPYHAVLRDEWDCPFAFSSSHSTERYDVYVYFNETGLPRSFIHDNKGSVADPIMYRDRELVSPHNLFLRLQHLLENLWPMDPEKIDTPYESRVPGLLFSQTPSMGEERVTNVDVYYDDKNYYANYVYDEMTGLYSRSYAGYPMKNCETNKPLMVTNIIVQWAEHSYSDNVSERPIIELIGSGPADIFINGTHIHGYWRRNSTQEPTRYFCSAEADAEQVLLKPGKTFVQHFPLTGTMVEDENRSGHIIFTQDDDLRLKNERDLH